MIKENNSVEYIKHHIEIVDGEKKFMVTIMENSKVVMTSCPCDETQKCYHVCMCLSDNEQFIVPIFREEHRKMLENLKSTKEGREIILQSKKRIVKADEELGNKWKQFIRIIRGRKTSR